MNVFPHASEIGNIHSGTIDGKLNGVIPTATPSGSAPRAGKYYGHSSQNQLVGLTVAPPAETVSSLTLGFRLNCGSGRHRSGTLRASNFAIQNLAFAGKLRREGVLVSTSGKYRGRACLHLDVTAAQVDDALSVMRQVVNA